MSLFKIVATPRYDEFKGARRRKRLQNRQATPGPNRHQTHAKQNTDGALTLQKRRGNYPTVKQHPCLKEEQDMKK